MTPHQIIAELVAVEQLRLRSNGWSLTEEEARDFDRRHPLAWAAARAYLAAPEAQPDVGAMEYRGNTVSFMYDRAKAYGDEIMRVWFVLKEAGKHPGRTDDPLHDVVRRALKDTPMTHDTPDPIVGHKTFHDEHSTRHEPLRESEANAILAASDAAKAKRASDMPTEQDAARAMWSAYQRLRELGWQETCYGPTNKSVRLIEPGSSGIHTGSRHEPWPEKTWWLEDIGDLWPSNPCLFKESPMTPDTAFEAALPRPWGYAYRYQGLSGDVIRFNNGEEVNGIKPIEAIPIFLGTDSPPLSGG